MTLTEMYQFKKKAQPIPGAPSLDSKHKHKLRRAYKKDFAVPSNPNYTNGERWLKLWVCTQQPCDYREAYDITHEEPN